MESMEADVAIEELSKRAPTMGKLAKVSYSHEAMIELILANPWLDQNQVAQHFGYTASWVSNIIASDAFQSKMASRREEVIDPILKATLEERFRGLVTRSLVVLMEKLDQPAKSIPDNVALRAAELGAKALGLGGHAPPKTPPIHSDHLTVLAERLIVLQSNVRERVINGSAQEVIAEPAQ